jgi:7 transmembrane helices usually fused to an inactive transglutaminase/Inactive transglutaminase fused to 7 transmembrane helices
MRNLHVYLLAAVLAAVGLGLTAYKFFVIGLPLRERASVSAWEVESEVRITANGGPLKLSMFVPGESREFSVLDQRLAAPDFGISIAPEGANRRLNLTARDAKGRLVARQRFLVRRNTARAPERRQLPPFPQEITFNQTAQSIARTLYVSAHNKSSDATSLVSVLLHELISPDRSANVRFLLGDNRSPQKIASLATQILRVNGYFARAVHGVDLAETGISIETKTWLEVHVGDHWQEFSVATGESRIPRGYFPWWRGDAPFVKVDGGKLERRRISITRIEETVLRHALALGRHTGAFLTNYSLYGLPATQRAVFRVIMTIPIGVFVLVVLRNIVGLRGVGTFMPVLIALSFRETHLVWGLVLFSVVLAAGLLVRLYFDHLKLLLVARLGAIVMFVILLLAAITVLSDKLSFEPGMSVALFPLVILTMTIERVSVIWDESGPAEAIRLAVLSLIIAAFCYLLMAARPVQHIFFAFPEMVLVLIALTLLIGRYTGYRLSELMRFKVLAEPRS